MVDKEDIEAGSSGKTEGYIPGRVISFSRGKQMTETGREGSLGD